MFRRSLCATSALSVGLTACPAFADLRPSQYFANAALIIDGLGTLGSGSGQLQANIPSGSQILGAYLYTASIWRSIVSSGTVFSVRFNGTLLTPSAGTLLTPDVNPVNTVRYDVTNIVSSAIQGGPGGLYNFNLQENGDNDGSVLVIAYRNAATQGRSALIYDGELSTTGDTTRLNFASPYTGGNLIMSLASSYSVQPSGQFTQIDVRTSNNPIARRLTTSAGGFDDGRFGNGALITVGGIGDSPANPAPFAEPLDDSRVDDELYNLALGNSVDANPFITPGDTWAELITINPSNDDNVFGVFISAD
ncbi:MAG: PEP-CTERM sorting domain-containing protein, partial [bacterium]